MKFHLILLPVLLWSFCSSSQEATISGVVSGDMDELLPGVSVYEENMKFTTVTDVNGKYELEIPVGSYTIVFQSVGKETLKQKIDITGSEEIEMNIVLKDRFVSIDAVVVSASKFERKQSEETVSIEVMQGDLIERQNPNRIDESINRIPGVTIMDGQAQIRGGSGWSYGSGSRVQVLLDGIPILSADAADAKWDMIPPDVIRQVEVIKGASSALYGSAAMNGIINLQTIVPSSKPRTKIRAYSRLYGNPSNDELKWWDGVGFSSYPKEFGASVTHLRKIKKLDLVAGLYFDKRDSYLKSKYDEQYRGFTKLRYRFSDKLKGLSIGLNALYSTRQNKTFILWNGIDSLGYLPLANTGPEGRNSRLAVDPFIKFVDLKGNQITVKARYFNSSNRITSDSTQASKPSFYYGEGQYQRFFDNIGFSLTAGMSGMKSRIRSFYDDPEKSLAGEHDASNVALYAQLEKELWNKLTISAGIRWEYFRIDSSEIESAPNARVGLNYHPTSLTFIRLSYGQAYRFPSIVEKYANTNLGGIGIFPNPRLESEDGWTAELGVKQLFAFGEWKGFVDVAGFYNRYNNMAEFLFGQYGANPSPPFFGLGFSAQNVGDTEIAGIEISTSLNANFRNASLQFIGGYYYVSPISLNWNDTLITFRENGTKIQNQTYASTSSSDENWLKYRSRHSFKADMELTLYDMFRIGVNMQYRSFIENIDAAFVSDLFILLEPNFGGRTFSGLKEWRERTKDKGEFVMDLRLSYLINEKMDVSFLVKNVTNNIYTRRPAIFEPPVNYTLKYNLDI